MERWIIAVADALLSMLLSPAFWIAAGILVLLLLLIRLYRRLKLWALNKAGYRRVFSSDGIFVGESLELTESIRNATWFPLFSVQVDFFIPPGLTVDGLECKEGKTVTSVFHIPPFSTVRKKHVVRADRREHYSLYTATILYRKNEFIFTDALDFYAYPNLAELPVPFSNELYDAGNVISNRKSIEDPFFFSGISPYSAGAPLRSINFKASVRSFSGGMRQLVCNHFDSSRSFDSMIFLDLASYANAAIDPEEQTETGLGYACFLFGETLKNSANVGFASNCARGSERFISIPCGSGELHNKRILEAFAEINWYAKRDYSITAMLERIVPTLNRDTDIFLISPSIEGETAGLLFEMKRMGYRVHPIPLDVRRTV